jgi:nucleoid-associated protein YgaU
MALVLGNSSTSIIFNVDELPESINLGGEQTLAVRKYPGGGKDVQALGSFDDPISWDGVFWFTDALSRCLMLDNMRKQGTELQLSFSSFSINVIINKFTYKYYHDYYIEYSITLEPLDYLNSLGDSSSTTSSTASSDSSATATNSSSSTSSTASSTTASPTSNPQQTSYTVVSGDTLWAIAVKFYGDGSKFTQIASDNNISNPNSLQVGQVLTINNPTQGA